MFPCANNPGRGLGRLAGLLSASFAGLGILAQSSPAPAIAPPLERLELHPSSIELRSLREDHGVLVTAVYRDGRVADVTRQARIQTNNLLVAATANGRLQARRAADTPTDLAVEFGGLRTNLHVSLLIPGAADEAPSFREEIEPILTRSGCNMGSCHGKLAGQNGFKLSLRAYAPEQDIDSLRQDVTGRRLDMAVPEASLLLLKALAEVPHEGGQRFVPGSRYHRVLLDWIAARAPGPKSVDEEPGPERLEILPGDRTLAPGEEQQLLVRAHYPGGRTRDVSWLAQFFSNDPVTASVSSEGRVRGRRAGATSVRAHFQGLVGVVRVTLPSTNVVDEFRFGRSHGPIDDAVFAQLRALRIPPSALCLDEVFLRRVMLDLTGTLPTPDEVREFLADKAPNKRARVVESLFGRPEFTDYWTLQLADLLQNRKERDHDVRGVKGVRAFHAWLRAQVAANRQWDALVRDLLTATGNAVERPEIGYYVTTVGEKPAVESEVVDSVAQAFLGTRVGCARCHNHPLERYTQDDFYRFAAFFSHVTVERKELEKGTTELVRMGREERDRRRELDEAGRKLKEAEAKLVRAEASDLAAVRSQFTDRQREFAERKRNAESATRKPPAAWQPRTRRDVEASPLDRTKLPWQPGDDPRAALAAWITSPTNDAFSGAMVNRLWRHFLGAGLVEPVDDLRASNPPSNPELMHWLRTEFVRSGFDLRHIMRQIVNSRTYQLASQTLPGNETETRFYSHYYARRLPAEVILDALSKATGVPETFPGQPVGVRATQLPEPAVSSYFLSLFGRSERVTACACERNGEVTLPQLLHLQNGEETARKIRDPGSRLKKLLAWKASREEVIEELYLAALGRRPRAEELSRVAGAFEGAPLEEASADLLWALLNSKEFAFNH